MAAKAKRSGMPEVESVWLDLPEGAAVFPWLNEPDTKYNPSGDYKTGVRVNGQIAAATVRELERIRDEYFAKIPSDVQGDYRTCPVANAELDDSGVETGSVIFNAKLHAKGENKTTGETWDQSPRLWDCDGKRVALTDSPIWSNSKLLLRVEARPYAMAPDKKRQVPGLVGVSLRLRDVLIVDLVTGGGGSSPFAQRDGYRRPASDGDTGAGEQTPF